MATIRPAFLIDLSLCLDFDIIYCDRIKFVQDQFKKYRQCYIYNVPNMVDKTIYTSDLFMRLKKGLAKRRECYIPPNVPKLVVDS